MNEYEATFSQDGRYITERRWPSPEHTYEIVNAVPLGYTVWNIGHPVAGEYLPLCRLSQHQPFPGGQSIDVDSLKAIRCDGAQTILDAVGYGPALWRKWNASLKRIRWHSQERRGTERSSE